MVEETLEVPAQQMYVLGVFMAYAPLEVTVTTDKLDKLSDELNGLLQDVVKVAAFSIERRAKAVPPPIDTGATMNSIHVTLAGGGGDYFSSASAARLLKPGIQLLPENHPTGPVGMAARIGPSTAYAPHLEFGTHNMPARPFMTPSFESERQPFIDAVGEIFERASRG
ncbi:MAG: hypothetical protein Q8P22_11580 [Chloroflexota bacterium]|nr:hypothetical protein [Chloroflexota bacterium]